jgi:hypothetical protein
MKPGDAHLLLQSAPHQAGDWLAPGRELQDSLASGSDPLLRFDLRNAPVEGNA